MKDEFALSQPEDSSKYLSQRNQSNAVRITTISAEQTLILRHQVLWPDKTPEFCRLPDDPNGIHYGAKNNGEIVCVASVFITGREARLRKFATEREYQGRGIGTAVISHIISDLQSRNISMLWFDARLTAVAFYRRLGFKPRGDEFIKSGVNYIKMQSAL